MHGENHVFIADQDHGPRLRHQRVERRQRVIDATACEADADKIRRSCYTQAFFQISTVLLGYMNKVLPKRRAPAVSVIERVHIANHSVWSYAIKRIRAAVSADKMRRKFAREGQVRVLMRPAAQKRDAPFIIQRRLYETHHRARGRISRRLVNVKCRTHFHHHVRGNVLTIAERACVRGCSTNLRLGSVTEDSSVTEEKRLSITFGKFSCEIVGYDEPFSILAKVVDIINATSKATGWSEEQAPSDEPEGRKRFAQVLSENASAFDLQINQVDGRFVISAPDDDTITDDVATAEITGYAAPAAPSPAPTPAPAARAPLHIFAPVAEPIVDEAPAESEAVAVAEDDTVVADKHEPTAETAETPDELTDAGEVIAEAADAEAPLVEKAIDEIVTSNEDDTTLDLSSEASVEADAETQILDEANVDSPSAPSTETAADAEADEPLVLEAASEVAIAEEAQADEPKSENEAKSEDDAPQEMAGDTPAAEPAKVERPRIVVDQSKRRAARPRVAVSTTVVKKAAASDAATEASEATAKVDTPKAQEAPTTAATPKRSSVKIRKIIAPVEAEDDQDDNFLFGDDEFKDDLSPAAVKDEAPLELIASVASVEATPEPVAPAKVAEATVEEPLALNLADKVEAEAPRAKRGPLNLGIFRRKSAKLEDKDVDLSDNEAGFDRLREAAEAALPKLEEGTLNLPRASKRTLFAVSGGAEHSEAESPAVFARQMGAQSLQDLLEASAAYISIVEGKARFSRREVMQALTDIGIEKDYTPEARLKSFRKLVTAGAIVRSDDGMFAISHATRFGYETQLRAQG